jgi:purine-nucleoside phosphorylase
MNPNESLTRAEIQETAQAIARRTSHRPLVGLILGSGLNPLADEVGEANSIPYSEIPHFGVPSVVGHVGKLVIGQLAGQEVLILQGRVHGYEGVSQERLAFPVRVMHELGVHTLIVTNAAGGINPAFRAGDLMLIVDHIGLAAMTGSNPLWGPNDEALGPRFVDMSKAYDVTLRRLALRVADKLNIGLRQGVYAGLSGPTFETPAEVRFLRIIGADAVGMSTVPEVIAARHVGMRVLGISGISNVAITDPDAEDKTNHEEVLAMGRAMVPNLIALLRGVLAEMPAP